MTGYVDALVHRSKALDADTWIVIGYRSLTRLGDPYLRTQGTYLRAEPAGLAFAAKNSDYGPKKANECKPK